MQHSRTIGHLIARYTLEARDLIARTVALVCSICALLLASGCSILPGTFVVPSGQPFVTESPEVPNKIDYSLLKITPLLMQQLQEEAKATQLALIEPPPLPKAASFPYRLGKQDVLRIFVWGNPDLTPMSSAVGTTNLATTPAGRVIDENGDVFFPMVGLIRAEGLTASEFRKSLTKRLDKFIVNPQIDLDVVAFRSQKVFVTGQVRNPGVLPITDQPMRVTDALGLAGGPTDNSDLYSVVITRGKVSVTVNVDRLYYDGNGAANVMLQDGDLITVPDRMTRKIFMLGEVGNSIGSNQARSYPMRRGSMSLTEVIADAGGVSPFSAAANEIYVMRLDKTGKPTIYQLDASQPQALLMAEQFQIQPRDLIFINPTAPILFGRLISQFLPVLQSAYIARTTPF